MSIYSIEIPTNDPKAMDDFNNLMQELQNAQVKHIEDEMDRLDISFGAACDIVYLRTRSRWTQEKEDYLIALARDNKALPNVMEWNGEGM